MSVVQGSVDISSANLTPELNKEKAHSAVSVLQNNGSPEVDKIEQQNSTVKVQKATAQQKNENTKETQPLTAEQLDKVAQQLQDFVGEMNRGLEFSVDKDSGRDVIKVVDKSTGDLVKQFPSEEVLTLVAKLSDMVGGFIDAKV
jgi:flagellar protein FlaG